MTATDLALLSLSLDQLTAVDLHSLDDAKLPWLPPLRAFARRRALREILNTLQAIKSGSQRLQCVAWLHCSLMQRHSVLPWTLFRFKRLSLLADFSKMLVGLVSVLRSRGYDVTFEWTVDSGTVYICLLTRDFVRGFEPLVGHQVSYVALWPGLPLLAVHVLDDHAKRCVLRALRTVLGDEPTELLDMPPGRLGAALRASFPHLSLQVGESTFIIPEVASLLGGPNSRGDKEKQRLEEWNAALAQLGSSLCPTNGRYTLTDGSGTWVHFEGPGLFEKLRKLYVNGADEIISKKMKPAFLGEHHHVVECSDK